MSELEELVKIVKRQTNYDDDTAMVKLKEFNNDIENVIRDYNGTLQQTKVEPTLSSNQKIFKAIRENFQS